MKNLMILSSIGIVLSTPESLFAQCLAADYVAQKYQDITRYLSEAL